MSAPSITVKREATMTTHAHTKKLHFPRVPLCLVAFGWGASLIQKSIRFCCIDSQPPTGRKRPCPCALIDGAVSFRHRCQHRNIDCWLKPKSIKLTQTGARSVCLPVAVMWLLTRKIDLTASKSLCEHCVDQCVRYNRIIDPTSAAWLQMATDIATTCENIKYSVTDASLQ